MFDSQGKFLRRLGNDALFGNRSISEIVIDRANNLFVRAYRDITVLRADGAFVTNFEVDGESLCIDSEGRLLAARSSEGRLNVYGFNCHWSDAKPAPKLEAQSKHHRQRVW